MAEAHHHQVVSKWVIPRLNRRSLGQKHPVDDFMFEYYPISAKKLMTWHPGENFQLEITDDLELDFDQRIYLKTSSVRINPDWLGNQIEAMKKVVEFLDSTMNRPARTGCFGLHEWAMVLGDEELRHADWPLRVEQAQIGKTITEVGLRCTHFDAFRFFTDDARGLNPLQLTRSDQAKVEQPGCLHANMDLYRIAMQWAPIVGSTLVRACFRLAREIRTVDMRSAPYDLSALGVVPILIETADGRSEFAQHQRIFSQRALILRAHIIKALSRTLTLV